MKTTAADRNSDAGDTSRNDRDTEVLEMISSTICTLVVIAIVSAPGSNGSVAQSSTEGQPGPPPGRLIDVGGYRLHLYCTGPRQPSRPTVVLSPGGGDYAVDWDLIQPVVAGLTRVCAYDRAGSGWSDPGPEPRSLRQEVGELQLMLAAAGERPPYVLVGHSLGGLIVRLFQSQKPRDVVGMVLVDPTHEDARLGYRGQLVRVRTLATGRAIPAVHTLGEHPPRLLSGIDLDRCRASAGTSQIYGPFARLPAKVQELRLWVQRNPKCVAPGEDYLPDELAALHADRQRNPQPLGAIPLVVIFAVRTDPPPGVALDEWRREKAEHMADLAHLSSQGRLISDERTGHHIHLDDPASVVGAIQEVLRKAAR